MLQHHHLGDRFKSERQVTQLLSTCVKPLRYEGWEEPEAETRLQKLSLTSLYIAPECQCQPVSERRREECGAVCGKEIGVNRKKDSANRYDPL